MFTGLYDYCNRSPHQCAPVPVHTSQMAYEIGSLVNIYCNIKPMRVLEIGSEHGGTLYHWLVNAQPGATVVTVDKWDSSVVPINPVERWRSWCPDGVDFHAILADSHAEDTKAQVIKILPEVDFLFIDGDHTYEGVKQDFMMYGPLVKHGVIAFHDLIKPTFSPHIGVGQLWREIQRAGYVTRELYALSADKQKWGGIGVVSL